MTKQEPAFPTTKRFSENYMDSAGYGRCREVSTLAGGMTIRDYFAAKAMQGIVMNPTEKCQPFTNSQLAQWSFAIADAMLEERKKE